MYPRGEPHPDQHSFAGGMRVELIAIAYRARGSFE